ncbi:hypothetical protein DFH29DRAFT_805964 [Suillus ampliporus]|nr:hypothetical protein DFH29DRAFT_805964 [Suillus ampliporus]
MRFSSIFLTSIFVAAILAQNIYIAAHTQNQGVGSGSNIIVDTVRNFQSSQEMANVIAIQSCNPSYSPGEALGDILYNGPYDPQSPNPNLDDPQPYQNFTVQVPSNLMGCVVDHNAYGAYRGKSS